MSDATGTSGEAATSGTAATGTLGVGTLGIAGVGLIGGSVAAAAKARGTFARVVGFGRSADRLEAAAKAGLIDDFDVDYRRLGGRLDVFVSCLPVDRIAGSVRAAAAHMPAGSVATDAGSVKGLVCEGIGAAPAAGVAFVGAHPIAGSEKQGFEHARPDLFVGRVCVLTPTGGEERGAVETVTRFWRSLGSEVAVLSPAEHDEILAGTSHLPHVAAAAVASGVAAGRVRFAAGGFRDTTRVASGDPDLWSGILLANREAVGDALGAFIGRCDAFRAALAAGDRPALRAMLTDARVRRDQFLEAFR